jgi:hypothetical protein
MYQGFGFCIARQRDCQIGISCEPRLGAHGNGQTANQCEGGVGLGEVAIDLAESRFERRHTSLILTSTGRP